MAFVSVAYPSNVRMILSIGLPLSDIPDIESRNEAIIEQLRQPTIIPDLSSEPHFANHPFVRGSMGLRYLVSVPLPPGAIPHPAFLICADPDNRAPRRPDLLDSLEQCARIFADNLGLMGDVAVLRERVANTRVSLGELQQSVRKADLPIGLVDSSGTVLAASRQLVDLLPIGAASQDRWKVSDLSQEFGETFESAQMALTDPTDDMRVMSVRSDGKPLMAHLIALPGLEGAARKMLLLLKDQTENTRALDRLREGGGESPMVVSRFLLDTLVRQPRVRRRGTTRYHVLMRWRRDLQDVQVAALRALKSDPPATFVRDVAQQLAAEAVSLFGRDTYRRIVPVPCGNSGPCCLSVQLASATAQILGLPMVTAFAPIPVRGSSHPRRNAGRPAMTLAEPVTEPVLLIDDVATSGAHLAEAATRLLAGGAPAVLPLVWIAP